MSCTASAPDGISCGTEQATLGRSYRKGPLTSSSYSCSYSRYTKPHGKAKYIGNSQGDTRCRFPIIFPCRSGQDGGRYSFPHGKSSASEGRGCVFSPAYQKWSKQHG